MNSDSGETGSSTELASPPELLVASAGQQAARSKVPMVLTRRGTAQGEGELQPFDKRAGRRPRSRPSAEAELVAKSPETGAVRALTEQFDAAAEPLLPQALAQQSAPLQNRLIDSDMLRGEPSAVLRRAVEESQRLSPSSLTLSPLSSPGNTPYPVHQGPPTELLNPLFHTRAGLPPPTC